MGFNMGLQVFEALVHYDILPCRSRGSTGGVNYLIVISTYCHTVTPLKENIIQNTVEQWSQDGS